MPTFDHPLLVQRDVVADEIVGELRAVGLDIAVRVPHRGGEQYDAGKAQQHETSSLLGDDEPDVVRLGYRFRHLRGEHAEDQERHPEQEGQRHGERRRLLQAVHAIGRE
jgi:hypothetical protein